MGGGGESGYTLKLPSPTKFARLGRFPPANQAGRLTGPVFYLYVFSLGGTINIWELGNNSYEGGGGVHRAEYWETDTRTRKTSKLEE